MYLKQDFSSRFRILKGGKISLVVSTIIGGAIIANASPTQGVVTSGNAIISQIGNTTNITQSTQKATINWQDFSIKSNETVNFNQPNSSSITLNRVVGNEKSIINGALNANGQVWILNSNGILFNKNAKVNTAGLIATTKELSDKDFQAGNYNFKGDSTNSVINLGTIEVSNNSYVVLASNEVKNSGTIKAVKGKVYLSGASEYTVNLNGNSIVDLVVSKGVLDAMVENSGTIVANGGEIYLTTNAVNELLKGVVNNTGVLEANSLDGLTGKVETYAHGGTTNLSGTIEAKDGFVETSGKNLNITDSAKVTANKWLLDPTNIIIESSGGSIGNESVSATAIQNALSTTNVELQADEDITVNENITWSTNKQLKLSAGDEIYVNATINNTNSTNGGVYFNAANMDDKVIFGTNGKVIINNVYQLQWIDTALRGKYELGSDIDASVTTTWNNGAGFDPLTGSYKYTPYPEYDPNYQITTYVYFKGIFDGNNHTISNLYMNYSGQAGLFMVTNNATIKNLGLINVNITGNSVTAGLVGVSQNNTLIENSYVTGSVTSTSSSAGGLVGDAANTTIKNSYSTANVSGQHLVGGLVGNLSNYSSIINSYSTGYVTPAGNAFGGLVGNSGNSSVTNSYWNTETSGQSTSAGGTGLTSAQFTDSSNFISWDSSIWAFSGNDFEGYASNVITSPVLKSLFTPTILFAGGYGTDVNPYTITNWTQLQNINNSNILTQNYYFKLLNNLSNSTSDYTNLASSIANGGKGWNSIGNSSSNFTGTFDGNNYTINSLVINNNIDSAYLGLFGYINNATIQNIGITNADIIGGNNSYIGGLVGYNYNGTIKNSYSNGNIEGDDSTNIGGLVGYNYNGNISNSYSKGSITTGNNAYSGGLVGYNNNGTIENTYSTANVTAGTSAHSGGLVGFNNGDILTSYATGKILGSNGNIGGLIGLNSGLVTNSFWNKTTSGQTTSAGGTGLTSEEMKNITTFKDAGWNINEDYSSSTATTPFLVTKNGVTSWALPSYSTAITYTLSTISNGYTYSGNEILLSSLWSTNNIFDSTYSSWILGTDYNFMYNGNVITSFTNAGAYSGIYIDILKSGYTENSNGSTMGSLVISKANATVTANSNTVIYNGTSQNISGFNVNGLVGTDTISNLTGITGTSASGKNVGTYTTALAGTDENYNLTFINGSLTIIPKAITVIANNKSKMYGDTNPNLTYTVNGLIQGDTLTGNLSTTATQYSNVGTYNITQGNLTNTNYDISFSDGLLTISAQNTTPTEPNIPTIPEIPIPQNNSNTEQIINRIITNINKLTRIDILNFDSNLKSNQTNKTNSISSVNNISLNNNSKIQLLDGGIKLPEGLNSLQTSNFINKQEGENN